MGRMTHLPFSKFNESICIHVGISLDAIGSAARAETSSQ